MSKKSNSIIRKAEALKAEANKIISTNKNGIPSVGRNKKFDDCYVKANKDNDLWERINLNTKEHISISKIIDLLIGDFIIVFEGNCKKIIDYFFTLRNILELTSKYKLKINNIYVEIKNFELLSTDLYSKLTLENFDEGNFSFIKELKSEKILVRLSYIINVITYNYDYDILKDSAFYRNNRYLDKPHFKVKIHVQKGVLAPNNRVLDLLLFLLLFEKKLVESDFKDKLIHEPCTGSGALSLLLNKTQPKKIVCSDIDEASVDSATINTKYNYGIEVYEQDKIYDKIIYDTIYINPPWFSKNLKKRSKAYKRCFFDDNFDLLKSLLKLSFEATTDEGNLYLTLGREDPFDKIIELSEYNWRITNKWELGNIKLLRLNKLTELGI